MPRKKNPLLRLVIPLAVVVVGVIAVLPALLSGPSQPNQPATQPGAQQAAPSAEQQASAQTGEQPAQPAATAAEAPVDQPPAAAGAADDQVARADDQQAPSAEPAAPDAGEGASPEAVVAAAGPALEGLSAATLGSPGEALPTLGSLDPDGPFALEVEFSRYGAGVASIALADSFATVEMQDHEVLQREFDRATAGVTPFSAVAVSINGQRVPLQAEVDPATGLERAMWRHEGDGLFVARVDDGEGNPVLRIERDFDLDQDSHDLVIRQRVINLTDRALRVSFEEMGPVELPQISKYSGDRRRVRVGYFMPKTDPTRSAVQADTQLRGRLGVLGERDRVLGFRALEPFWPTERAARDGYELVWLAQTNRYFAVALHSVADAAKSGVDLALAGAPTVERFVLNAAQPGQEPVLGFQLTSGPFELAAGEARSLDRAVYAGPLEKDRISGQPYSSSIGLEGVVTYNFGGMCGPCTFSWLTGPLIWLLEFLHDYLLFDWALAIMALVLIVRGILHPVTRWSQIRIQRFAKQMQEMAPKQQKLKERFKDDPKRMQQEMAKLWREEGVSPAGALGCLPMFLQSPVWIALYATLFFAYELRHEPAFFGIFQSAGMAFLNDLSQPDHFIPFGTGFHIPLISGVMGPIEAFNVLPILLGVVFFLHQKYLTPTTSATMTPEQQQQQKIIKVMMVVLFPIFMYNAPSGLALYFITNSALAIFENRWIRAHIDANDLLNVEEMRKRRKAKPGLFQKLQQMAEAQQQLKAQQQAARGRSSPNARSRSAEPTQPRYKKRK